MINKRQPRLEGAFAWNIGGTAVRVLLAFFVNVAMTRLLGPEPFGIIALCWAVIGLACLMSDMGISAALVQPKHLTEKEIRFGFTFQMMMAILLSAILAVLAPAISRFFKTPDLAPVLRWMSLIFILQVFGQTAGALLRRRMEFKTIQMTESLSYLVAFIAIGLPMAVSGYGVWSLVVPYLAQRVLSAVWLYYRTRYSLLPYLGNAGRLLAVFGFKTILANVASWAVSSMDSFVVGKVFGITPLGGYNRISQIAGSASHTMLSGVQGVLYPAYSISQNNFRKVKEYYLTSCGVAALLVFPACFAVAVIPGTVIGFMYGPSWLRFSHLLTPISLAVPFYFLTGIGGPLLYGLGYPGRELRVQALTAVVLSVILAIGSRFSLHVVAWGVFFAQLFRWIIMTSSVLRTSRIAWKEVIGSLVGPLAGAFVAATAAFGMDALAGTMFRSAFYVFCADTLAGAVAWLVFYRRFGGSVIRRSAFQTVNRVSSKLWISIPRPRPGFRPSGPTDQ